MKTRFVHVLAVAAAAGVSGGAVRMADALLIGDLGEKIGDAAKRLREGAAKATDGAAIQARIDRLLQKAKSWESAVGWLGKHLHGRSDFFDKLKSALSELGGRLAKISDSRLQISAGVSRIDAIIDMRSSIDSAHERWSGHVAKDYLKDVPLVIQCKKKRDDLNALKRDESDAPFKIARWRLPPDTRSLTDITSRPLAHIQRVEADAAAVASCTKGEADRRLGPDVVREAWAAIKKLSCGELVGAVTRLGKLSEEIKSIGALSARCAQKVIEGFVCGIPDMVVDIAKMAVGIAEKMWEHKWVCGAAGVITAGPGAVLCGAVYYLVEEGGRAFRCLRGLGRNQFWGFLNLVSMDTGCKMLGGIVLDAVLGALTGGATVTASVARWIKKINDALSPANWTKYTRLLSEAKKTAINATVGAVTDVAKEACNQGR